MKIITIICFFICFGQIGFTQSKYIDSLSKKLSLATDDKSKVLLISEIGYYYRLSKPDTAIALGQKALAMAQEINFPQGEAHALTTIGATYRISGDLQNAMLYCFKSNSIAQKYDFKDELSRSYITMGVAYSDLKEYDLSIQYLKSSIKIRETIDNKELYATAIANLGDTYLKKNQLDSALIYLHQANYMMIHVNNSPIVALANYRMAATYLKLKHYDTAYAHIIKALDISTKGKSIKGQSIANQLLAQYYKSLNKIDSAIYYAKQGFDLAEAYKYKGDMLDLSDILSELYEQKDIKQAYYYTKISKSLNDSIYGVDRVNALQKKIIQEQEVVRNTEAKNLAAQNRLKQNGLLVILGLMAIAGYFLYRSIRQKQKANQDLEKTLTQLKSTQTQLIQSEKLASLGELTAGIAHEIQNPLNFVNNFSELSVDLVKDLKDELKRPEKDDTYIDELFVDLSQNQEKINHHGKRASSIVKGMLEHSRASTGVRELTDINKLADEYLRLSYHGMRAKDNSFNADFSTDFDENLPKIEVIPQDIGRVLLNLINNAFYAVNEKKKENTEGVLYKPTVTVSTQQIDNQIIIKVKDNGTGMPESVRAKVFQPFFTTKPTGQGTGLGLSLAYDIVTKGHGGILEVVSTEGVGTEFKVTLSL